MFVDAIEREVVTMERFKGKVAVVTGGNSGIGLATAKAYVREGARVAITGRSETTLETAQKELGADALVIRADMSRVADITAAMHRIKERFGRIDAMLVCAFFMLVILWVRKSDR